MPSEDLWYDMLNAYENIILLMKAFSGQGEYTYHAIALDAAIHT